MICITGDVFVTCIACVVSLPDVGASRNLAVGSPDAGKLMTEAGAPWQQYDLSDSEADDVEASPWRSRQV